MYKYRIVVVAKDDDREYLFSLRGTDLDTVEKQVKRMSGGNWYIKSISRADVA